MLNTRLLGVIAVCAMIEGCAAEPVSPDATEAASAAQSAIASSCPLAAVPLGAVVVTCFETTLQPGVFAGFILQRSTAQPTGFPDGAFDRTRLNHAYMLASPNGFTRLGPGDVSVVADTRNLYAIQTEFWGPFNQWNDVIRLYAGAGGPPQRVPVVVYYLSSAQAVAAALITAIDELRIAAVVNEGQANALTRKVEQALSLLARGKRVQAVDVLVDFIQQVRGLTGPVFTPAQANSLITAAENIITLS